MFDKKKLLYSIIKYSTKPNYVLIYQQFNFCVRVMFHINNFIQLHDIFYQNHMKLNHTRDKNISHIGQLPILQELWLCITWLCFA